MTNSSFDTISPSSAPLCLPFKLEQRTCTVRTLCLALLMAPAVLALALPAGLALWLLANQPDTAQLSSESPVAFMQLLLLPLLAGLLCWLPLKAVAWRIHRRRQVVITSDLVVVEDASLFGNRSWQAPLAEFRGIAHNVRTSLSGARHELILVHPDARHSILLHFADRIPQSLIECTKDLLRLPEVTTRELHRLDPNTASWLPQSRMIGAARA